MKQTKKLYLSLLIVGCIIFSSVFVYGKRNAPLTPDEKEQLVALLNEEKNDPNWPPSKYENDIVILTKGLSEEPDNEHYLFYLARAHKGLNHIDEAIKWATLRIEKEGNRDEIWYAKFILGQCYQEKNNWDEAFKWLLEAYLYNPTRAEPLQKMATYYRVKGQNDQAYQYAKQGSLIPYPKNQTFFVNDSVYDYQFDEELSIAAFYTPFKEEGFAAANRLVLNKKAPGYVKEQAYKNALFYITNLKNTHSKPILIKLPLIREGYEDTYHPLNPSIQKMDDGYQVICRTVNYKRNLQLHYLFPDPNDRWVRTKNFLLEYDRDFNLLSQREIIENLPREHHQWTNIAGLEECRLIPTDKKTSFTCTICDTNPHPASQICYCSLANDSLDENVYVDKLTPIKGPNPNRWEKNWLPFLLNGELYTIYSYDPFIIHKPDIETGECPIVLQYEPTKDFSRFKGSAGPILFDDGYLVVVHETVFNDRLNYVHRFLFLDKNFKIKKLSKPFKYMHSGIEFCCGMALDHSENNLVMTIGVEDREAYVFIVDVNTVRDMLEPL